MSTKLIVRGRITDPRHIELLEPISEVCAQTEVELSVRPVSEAKGRDVFALIASFPAGSRTKADIDRQIEEERNSWTGR